jgi:hypothetical protein
MGEGEVGVDDSTQGVRQPARTAVAGGSETNIRAEIAGADRVASEPCLT